MTAYRIQKTPPPRTTKPSRCTLPEGNAYPTSPGQKLDLLKVVHDATSMQELRAVLLPGDRLHAAVDAETGIDALCFIADNINENLLRVTAADSLVLDRIARAVALSLDVELLRGAEMAQLIWVLEVVDRETTSSADTGRSWRLQLMKSIAERMTKPSSADAISALSTRDLVNLTCSIGTTQLFASSAPVVRFLILVLDELILRLAKPHVRSAFAIRDLGLVASAVASAHEVRPTESGEARGAFEAFLERLWADVMSPKLSNRHTSSLGGGKSLAELNSFLFSYVRVFGDEPPERMLQGISSYQTRLLKAELEAEPLNVTFVGLAAVLEFFAFYASRSTPGQMPPITVVELVSVVGACMRRLTLIDADTEDQTTAIASLLDSHMRLNLRPAQETLLALSPYLYARCQTTSSVDRLDARDRSLHSILESFSAFGFDPGSALRDVIA